MYVRLGNANLVYETPSYDNFMIFAEVIDSQMSFERPIVVYTKDQLDAWFGREFTSRDYFEELLDRGIALYLTKPVSSKEDTKQVGYLNTSDYYTMPGYYDIEPELPEVSPGTTEIKRLYRLYDEEGIYKSEEGDQYSLCIWYYEPDTKSWIFTRVQDLPQNIGGFKTSSLNNRDVLKVLSKSSKISYVNPKYSTEDSPLQVVRNYTGKKDFKYSLDNISLERIKIGYQTLAFNITYSTTTTLTDGSYIVLPGQDGKSYLLYYGSKPKVNEKYYSEEIQFTSISGLLRNLGDLGYILDTSKGLLYSTFPVKTTYFYEIPGFELVPSYEATHQLLWDQCQGDAVLSFYSKTIGPGGEDGNIKVSITSLEEEGYYRVEISRFDALEVFEGYFTNRNEAGRERLDYTISKTSALVYCDYIPADKWVEPWEGTFELRGAEKEEYTPESYNQALDILFNERDDQVLPDFLLVPEVQRFGTTLREDDTLQTYQKLLGYAQTLGCQVLIENSEEEDSVKHFIHNYTGDVDNRLVYFFKNLTINGFSRPGYYLFLLGILTDEYSISTGDLYYTSPTDGKNPYTTKREDLERKKCNYLVDNNQVYYYKKYFNGKNPNTSVLMRFVLGKVSRELEKNKWSYLAQKMVGRIRSNIEGVLDRVLKTFSIIRGIYISDFEVISAENKIKLSVDIRISDLVENDIRLDLIINYNKN